MSSAVLCLYTSCHFSVVRSDLVGVYSYVSPLSLFLPLRPHLKHRLSEIVLLCLLLTAGEWLQEKVPILAFPWSAAWLTVTSSPLLLQSATLISCRLTSFIIFLLNGLHGEIYTSKKRFAYTAFALLLQGANLSYGLYSINLDKSLITFTLR